MYIGIDIGGTKCAVVRGVGREIDSKLRFETTTVNETLDRIFAAVSELLTDDTEAIGISCGGPLDSERGIIQSPPNLPGWDDIHITEMLEKRFKRKTYLCNDADACALAEWRYGAGQGTKNMIFMTFGTGLGAGLILGGRLYSGTCGMAGEIGHVSLYDPTPDAHIGYNKRGAVEGYCSGGGIAQYGKGSARELGIRAENGDPEAVVIGSIYARSKEFIEPAMNEKLGELALLQSVKVCRIVPAALGESIGDIAALCVAEMGGEFSA